MHEITDDNSVVYYCDSCRRESMLAYSKNVTALCMIRNCTFCGKKKLVNVYKSKAIFIPLDEHGVAKDTYVEREGV